MESCHLQEMHLPWQYWARFRLCSRGLPRIGQESKKVYTAVCVLHCFWEMRILLVLLVVKRSDSMYTRNVPCIPMTVAAEETDVYQILM